LNYRPDWSIAPGEIIEEELEARMWSVTDMAERMHVEPAVVAALLKAETPVTPELATKISQAFGTSEQLWLNLESAWQEFQTRKVTVSA
jgi:addiction module HigA family antidote